MTRSTICGLFEPGKVVEQVLVVGLVAAAVAVLLVLCFTHLILVG